MTNFTVDTFMINQSIQNNAMDCNFIIIGLRLDIQIQKYKLNAMINTNTRNR